MEPPAFYYLSGDAENVSVSIKDSDDNEIRVFNNVDDKSIRTAKGLHSFHWNLRYPNAQRVDGVVTRGNQEVGPKAVPGQYSIELTVDGETFKAPFAVEADPRVSATNSDLQAQHSFLWDIRNRLDELNKSVIVIRSLNLQIQDRIGNLKPGSALESDLQTFSKSLSAIEQSFVQVNAKARKDLHANPVALNDKLYRLSNFASRVDAAPTPTQIAMFSEYSEPILKQLAELSSLLDEDLPPLNSALSGSDLSPLVAPDLFTPAGAEVSAQMPN